jgi:putative transcriptional regulator
MQTRLKEFREKAGLTQQQLADYTGVTRQTILFLEKSQYNPSLRLAFKIAKVLNLSVDTLFSFDDED